MVKTLKSSEPGFAALLQKHLHWEEERSGELIQQVAKILADVKSSGDEAVLEYTNRWDATGYKSAADFKLVDMDKIARKCPADVKKALKAAKKRIESYHKKQLPKDKRYVDASGTTLGWKWTPVSRAGLYVPGGRAAYPSSVLMNAIPAIVAGVKELAMVVPAPNGVLNPAVIAAAKIAGITEIYTIGGAQAVGALAFGTASIRKVDKIVGPGNAYVAEAKRQVFGLVGIDMIAGPSEILVVADDAANPKWIAADLLSQAEHDKDARSILVTDSAALAAAVEQEVAALLATLSRREIAAASWEKNGLIITAASLDEATAIANDIAAEHVELMVRQPEALAEKITNAGAIFLGGYTPEPIGDYIAGPSHVLPTSGSAKFSSGLSVYDFMKRTSLIGCTAESYKAIAPAASRLAEEEGLTAHKLSVDIRG